MPGAQTSGVLAVEKDVGSTQPTSRESVSLRPSDVHMHLDNESGNSVSPKREAIDPGGRDYGSQPRPWRGLGFALCSPGALSLLKNVVGVGIGLQLIAPELMGRSVHRGRPRPREINGTFRHGQRALAQRLKNAEIFHAESGASIR
jgi:hypothetical protein